MKDMYPASMLDIEPSRGSQKDTFDFAKMIAINKLSIKPEVNIQTTYVYHLVKEILFSKCKNVLK